MDPKPPIERGGPVRPRPQTDPTNPYGQDELLPGDGVRAEPRPTAGREAPKPDAPPGTGRD